MSRTGKKVAWQEAYNRLLELAFEKKGGWQLAPVICKKPMHKGDFLKNGVFVEVQFGNSATVYRDYYKFHYGLTHKLLSLAVLIVPVDPKKFFPSRPSSVSNMAEFALACRYFQLLPIPVPILVYGLLPEVCKP